MSRMSPLLRFSPMRTAVRGAGATDRKGRGAVILFDKKLTCWSAYDISSALEALRDELLSVDSTREDEPEENE